MNARTTLVASAVLGLLATGDAAAQKLSLRIDQGVVTLEAENVTIDEILARWTGLTGLNVVSKNGEGSDIPVTLRFSAVPEREAMTTLLRGLSGYIMGERRDPRTGIVTIDRLMILPESAAQPPTAATPVAAAGRRLSPFMRTPPAPASIEPSLPAALEGVESETAVELAPQPSNPPASPFGNSRGTALDPSVDATPEPVDVLPAPER
jgi:hypothetical protein